MPESEPIQILRPDGTATVDEPVMGDDQLLEAMRWILFSRAYDRRALILQRQGKFGVFSQGFGQEAAIVGSSLAIDPHLDWIVPQYRELVAYVRQGYPLDLLTAAFLGKAIASRIPDDVKLLPVQVAPGAQLPHAVGLAWGLRLQSLPGVVITYFGDGGSSAGDFHEALNFAGVFQAPVIFFLQDNQWAISTPRSTQSAACRFAARAKGYGIAGVTVDGNDLLAVYSATAEAVQRARDGGGATLIEAVTYRLGAHNTSDNPSMYEDDAGRKRAMELEPLERLRTYLTRRGLWNSEREAATVEEVETEVDAAFEQARELPAPVPEDMWMNIYEETPLRVSQQREQFLCASRELAPEEP